MPRTTKTSTKARSKRPALGPGCPIYAQTIDRLGKYFDVCNSLLRPGQTFWFRGHGTMEWNLTPSALRDPKVEIRNKALRLLADFKRFGEIKLPNPPSPDDELKWVQLAQHYGLPTRLLDWTQNAAIALYFACLNPKEKSGAVLILNPIDLNRAADPKNPRIFDAHLDAATINQYSALDGKINKVDGLRTIAIHPTWNSERIMLQQGAFTLHGSRGFTLTNEQARSLVCLEIKKKHKPALLHQLERVGINEMSIFPELDHMCNYLKNRITLS
ncbi:MAG: FRG domain-containing protein [Planctomycetota bacterium]